VNEGFLEGPVGRQGGVVGGGVWVGGIVLEEVEEGAAAEAGAEGGFCFVMIALRRVPCCCDGRWEEDERLEELKELHLGNYWATKRNIG
jgi:hypothetical protein